MNAMDVLLFGLFFFVLPQVLAIWLGALVASKVRSGWMAFVVGGILTVFAAGLFGGLLGLLLDNSFFPGWFLLGAVSLQLGLISGPTAGLIAVLNGPARGTERFLERDGPTSRRGNSRGPDSV
jgi:hypothetical protein